MLIPKKVRIEVFNRDRWRCQNCGAKVTPDSAMLDHILPVASGGSSDVSNLRTVCPKCNLNRALLNVVSTPISKQLAVGWITAFTRAPRITSAVSIITGVIGAGVGYLAYSDQKKEHEAQRLESQTYAAQITRLNDTEQKIRELLAFVTDQQIALKKTEDAVAALKAERDTLAPLVESQQKVVDALFAAQEKRNAAAIQKERWVGFGLGVASSIVASALWMIGRYFFTKGRDVQPSAEMDMP